MWKNVLKIIFLWPRYGRDTIQFSFSKQISLKHLNSCGFKPHPLFWCCHAHSTDLNFKWCTAFYDRLNNCLPWPTFMNIGNQFLTDFNSVRLEAWQGNKPAKPAPKWSIATLIPAAFSDLIASANSSNRDMTSLSVNSTMICSGTRALAFISLSKKRLRQVR